MALSNKSFANYGATSLDPEVVVQPSSSRDISSLYDSISGNIDKINTGIRYFTSVEDQIGTQQDTAGLRDQIFVRIVSMNQLVKSTQKDISKLSSLSRGANKQQKLQIQRLTGHFKDIVEKNCQKQQSVVNKLRSNTAWSNDKMESSGDGTNLLEAEQIQIQKNLEFEQEMLLERQHRIKEIENQILDANELMRELSALISDQGTMVDSIERQIENVNENVQMGHTELNRAANYAAKVRRRKFIMLLILTIILAVLIGIVIWQASS